jgi:hypothetical protein
VNNKADLQTSLDEVTNAVAEFSKVQAGLSELREKYEKVIFPVDTTDGMKDAKEARQAIRGPRYEVERIRKEAKAPILSLGRQLDSKAKEITDALLAIEEPIDLSIKHEEGRKERERQAKIEAEQKRVESIQERITEIRGALPAVNSFGAPSSEKVAEFIADVEKIIVDESFDEFRQQAEDAKAATLATLRELHKSSIEREAEQERIAAERAELENLRAKMAEQEAKARADREAAEAEAKAKREEEDRKQRAALEAERKRQAEEQARIDAENKKLADERAELERQKAAERRKAEEAERKRKSEEAAELQRREEAAAKARKAKYPGERAIVEALCEHFGVTAEVVQAWLSKLREAA